MLSRKLAADVRIGTLLVGIVVVTNLLVFALGGYSLYQSRLQNERRAELLTQNLASAIDQSISSSIAKVDVALQTVTGELERQLAEGGIRHASMNAFIESIVRRLPEVEAMRVASADGNVILGRNVDRSARTTWGDREYFLAHRQRADGGLIITKPLLGRVSGKWHISLTRRYNHPDGRFAGVVAAPVSLDHLTRLLTGFDAGRRGVIVLRDKDLGLIARVPAVALGQPGSAIGDTTVSKELRDLAMSGVSQATYHTPLPTDRIARIVTFHRLSVAPWLAIVGVATDDYLEDWRANLARTASFLAVFLLVTALSAWLLHHAIARANRENQRSRLFLQSASDGIHILDSKGNLVEASDSFARMLGYRPEELVGINICQWEARWSREALLDTIIPGLMKQETPTTLESRHRRKDGSLIDIELNVVGFDLDGKRLLYASSRDITEQKENKAALAESELWLKTIIDTEPECVKVVNPDGRLRQMNRAGLDMLEAATLEDVAGHPLADFVTPEHRRPFLELQRTVLAGGKGTLIFEVAGLKGTRRWLETHAVPLRNRRQDIIGLLGVSRDITERLHAEEALRASEQRFRALIEASAQIVWSCDPQGRVTEDSPSWRAYTGQTREQWLDYGYVDCIHPDDREPVMARWRQAMERGEAVSNEYRLRHHSGNWRWNLARGVPLRDANGAVTSWVGMNIDTHDRKTTELALQAAKELAEAASVAKSQFLATMSHEIRTPMNGILGMAQLLLMPDVKEAERTEYARTILESGQVLLTLLNDILDLSKVEAGKIDLALAPVDPARLLADVAALFAGPAADKGLPIETAWQGLAGRRYLADPLRLRQMLSNLVSNAIKFTERGRIRIDATELECTDHTALVEFAVTDTGIGIAPDMQDRLFKPFSQVDSSITRQYGGTGLGLSIVHSLALLMGGSVGVDSTAGSGARFWFRVPVGLSPSDPGEWAERHTAPDQRNR